MARLLVLLLLCAVLAVLASAEQQEQQEQEQREAGEGTKEALKKPAAAAASSSGFAYVAESLGLSPEAVATIDASKDSLLNLFGGAGEGAGGAGATTDETAAAAGGEGGGGFLSYLPSMTPRACLVAVLVAGLVLVAGSKGLKESIVVYGGIGSIMVWYGFRRVVRRASVDHRKRDKISKLKSDNKKLQ